MKPLQGILRYESQVRPRYQTMFEELAHGQSPNTMVIGCADSRIDTNLLFGASPGEVFTLRNIAALVPRASSQDVSVSSAVTYGVDALGVRDIVVCGHSSCGGITALLAGGAGDENIDAWLSNAATTVASHHLQGWVDTSLPECDQLSQRCVLEQVQNLCGYDVVANKRAKGELNVYAMWFDIAAGRTLVYDGRRQRFQPISEISEIASAAE